MAWPCRREAWDGPQGLARAKDAYAAVAKAISRFELVVMAARLEDAGEARDATGCDIFEVALDDSWARDIGPTFVTGPFGRAAVQWRFNAWGRKCQPFDQDAAFAAKVAEKVGVPLRPAPIICEGGAIHSDEAGDLPRPGAVRGSIPTRNPGLTKDGAEQVLRDFAGAQRMIWLGEGFSDSETDGHVDNIACFAGAGRVILGVPESKSARPSAGDGGGD